MATATIRMINDWQTVEISNGEHLGTYSAKLFRQKQGGEIDPHAIKDIVDSILQEEGSDQLSGPEICQIAFDRL